MNFYCDTPSPVTTDPANPVANISSEAPDADVFIGRRFNPPVPPLLGPWKANGCPGGIDCVSTISQEDADLCAARQMDLCVFDSGDPQQPQWNPNPNNPPPPNPNGPPPAQPPFIITPRPIFTNTAQSCAFTCPDGSPFSYTIAAGLFTGLTQAEADNRAYTYACARAAAQRVCIGSLGRTDACLGDSFDEFVTFTAAEYPVTVGIVNGGLPPGMSLTNTQFGFTISGPASGVGSYPFVVQVTDPSGNFMQKNFTIEVAAIATSLLPDGTVSTAYSQPLSTTGPVTANVVWSIVSGSLPPGLTLNTNTGVISGTPTTAGDYTFTVQMEDGF